MCLFQLHHTGIKTWLYLAEGHGGYLFQLHHTGIKTAVTRSYMKKSGNFNCTIQELKRLSHVVGINKAQLFQLHHTGIKTFCRVYRRGTPRNFNCTIQELKHRTRRYFGLPAAVFQLHHTGIKTGMLAALAVDRNISIAPYRN